MEMMQWVWVGIKGRTRGRRRVAKGVWSMKLPWKSPKISRYPLRNSQCTLPRMYLGSRREKIF